MAAPAPPVAARRPGPSPSGQAWPLQVAGALLVALVTLPVLFLALRGLSVGTEVAVAVLGSPLTWMALLRTLAIGAAVAGASVALAVPLAWLLHCSDLPGRAWFRVLLVLPLAVPSYVSGFVVLVTFAPGGWLPLFDVYGAAGTFLALLFTYPFALLTVQAALQRLDPRLWESARSLGCSPWQAFSRVILPQLRPSMAGGAMLVALYAVGDFGAVSLLRYESLSYLVYLRHKSLFEGDEAVVLSLLLVAVSAALVLGLAWFGGRAHRALGTHRRPWPTVPLGRWRWPAFGLCLTVALSGFVLPVTVVVGWLLRGVALGRPVDLPLREAGTSLLLGAAAAVLLVAVAFVPTLLERFGGGRGRLVGLVSHLGYAMPGIVVALALVSVASAWAHPLYQTFTLLLLAYVVRFLPLAVHAIDDAVTAQGSGLVQAARSLGCSPAQAWWRVVLPNAVPGVLAGLLAVFLAVIKELPITLLLSPIGTGTLATRIWSLTEDAWFSAAAPSVLLLLGLAVCGLLLRDRGRP